MSSSITDVSVLPPVRRSRRSPIADFLSRLLREKPLGMVGAIIVIVMGVTAICADLVAPYGYNDFDLMDRLKAPSGEFLLGTDNLGRDILSRVIYGARISMVVGLGAAAVDVSVAVLIGVVSGFIGGKFDLIIQRFVDAWLCFPLLIIALSVMSILGPGLIQVIFTIGVVWGIGGSRVARSAVISIKENAYILAANAIGASRLRILTRHILPNVAAPVIVIFTLAVAGTIITEATLSFLGFGVPPPQPSWGGMLSAQGRDHMLRAPWMALWPGLALSLTVFGVHVFGDALRDLLDPRLRGGIGSYGSKPKDVNKRIRRLGKSGFGEEQRGRASNG